MAQASTVLKGSFQSPCECLTLDGWVDPSCIIDPDCPATNVMKQGLDWTIVVNFGIYGSAVPLMGGTFCAQAFFEGLGTAEEVNIPTTGPICVDVTDGTKITTGPQSPGYEYSLKIPVSAKDLNEVGVYNMVVAVTYKDAQGNPGPLAGISDEKLIQVFP